MAKQGALSCLVAILFLCFLAKGFCQDCKSEPSFKDLTINTHPLPKENIKDRSMEYQVSVRNLCGCKQTNVKLSCPGFNSNWTATVKPTILAKNGEYCNLTQEIQAHQTVEFKYVGCMVEFKAISSTVSC